MSHRNRSPHISEAFIEADLIGKEEGSFHGTALFEQHMLALIRDGDTDKLRRLLEDPGEPLTEGVLSDDPLRQAKNIFIGLVTMVGKTAAIPGGLDVEEVYRLIDLYIRECEKAASVETVRSLQYDMLFDFTDRVAQSKLPDNLTWKIAQAMDHIKNNTHSMLSLDQVAAHIGHSRAWLTQTFKRETGLTVNQYQTRCKVQDAKQLLRHSQLTLSEISSYLGFSSQPYFQKVFRREVGCTPVQYREYRDVK